MDTSCRIENIRHAWPEAGRFRMERPYGCEEYVFLHFWDAMQFTYNGERITTAPHACILFAPRTPQSFGSDSYIIHDWMHLTGRVDTLAKECGLPLDTLFYPRQHRFITDIMRELETDFFSDAPMARQLSAAKLTELFIKLSRENAPCEQKTPINERTVALLQSLRRRLCLEYSEHWTVERMAAAIGLSPSYLYAVYKNYYHIAPTSDLISIRIERAKFYLTGTEFSVGALASMLGYANTTHFIRQFTKNVGVSPLQYRKNHLSPHADAKTYPD